ncbi:hypothetical protein AYO44_00235 [Planctomycetaceae bacterium SCGC AG-212-F19]|nr:hypothetical protein AYO44_00235 [Planctomycetaceae bacterium SCGC AG-212-F19]
MSQALHQPSMTPAFHPPGELHEPVPETPDQLHGDDWKAAAMVPGLMVSIFTTGLVMYVIIALLAMAGSP